MDTFTHTLLALFCMIFCWFWGRHLSTKNIISHLLDTLERDGYIKTKIDSDGDKCLIKFEEMNK